MSTNKITIIGAGLAGSLLSVYLAKKCFQVEVYERRPDMRREDTQGGKSINLALSTRGIYALKEVGLYDEIKKISIPMYGRMIHLHDGTTQFQRYGKDDSEYINSVSRAELNKKLMTLAETFEGVKFYFSQRCTGMNFDKNEIHLHDDIMKQDVSIYPDVVIATDGATSPVRMEMMKIPRFNFSQVYENYGYKELNIPPDKNGRHRMEVNALHIWPRGSFMLIALPNTDGSFTCTLFLAYDKSFGEENSFEAISSEKPLKEFFKRNFSDVVPLMPTLHEDFFHNPTGTLMTVKCYPWTVNGKVALLGDSAHAIVPFFGQGMNAAFEDCTYLNQFISKNDNDWIQIFESYQNLRKQNTDAIADLAQENFIEMRDKVAQPRFQLKKQIETELFKRYPKKFIPKYSMVTFHRIAYSIALERGKIQEKILENLSEGIKILNEVDWNKAENLVDLLLNELEIS